MLHEGQVKITFEDSLHPGFRGVKVESGLVVCWVAVYPGFVFTPSPPPSARASLKSAHHY